MIMVLVLIRTIKIIRADVDQKNVLVLLLSQNQDGELKSLKKLNQLIGNLI